MAKIALLIGVSDYLPGLRPLPKAAKDVEALQQVLHNQEMAGFDQANALLNPTPQTMREAIEALFTGRTKDDLVMLFFSGHGIKDDQGRLYFATSETRQSPDGELIKSTSVEASFVQDMMSNSRCKRQVVILDCCFSGAFAAGMEAKDAGIIDIETQLGGEGRAVLTSSTSTQYSFEEQTADLSIYTHYLVEGLKTGAADLGHDGWIDVEELHDYTKRKVQETAPAMKPEIYAIKEGFKIRLTQAPVGDPKLRYRQEVERLVRLGQISVVGRSILMTLQAQLGLAADEATAIEGEVLKPYQDYQRNLQHYEQTLQAAIEQECPLSDDTRHELKELQKILGLRNEDITPIESRIIPSLTIPQTLQAVESSASPTIPPPSSSLQSWVETPSQPSSSPIATSTESKLPEKQLSWFGRSVLATAIGSVVGGFGGWLAYSVFGADEGSWVLGFVIYGAAIGLAQWLILKSHIHRLGWWWMLATTLLGAIAGVMSLEKGAAGFFVITTLIPGVTLAIMVGWLQDIGATNFPRLAGWTFWFQWVGLTTGGLGLGIVSIPLLMSFRLIRSIPDNMVLIGFVMGTVAGTAQWLVLRKKLPDTNSWILATAIGAAVALGIAYPIASRSPDQWAVGYFLGSAILGVAQWFVLKQQISMAGWWILANAISGALFGGIAGTAVEEIYGIPLLLTFALLCVAYAAITGGVMVWLLRQSAK